MEITFQSHPEVSLGGNTFLNTPTILQFEDIPLLEVGQYENAGYTTRFPVYHNDGNKIAVVVGSRIHLTAEGKNANIKPRFQPDLTVFELEGKPILELRRKGAAAFSGWAELYAPEGILIRAFDSSISGLLRGGDALQLGGMTLMGNTFAGCRIGVHITHDHISIGVG